MTELLSENQSYMDRLRDRVKFACAKRVIALCEYLGEANEIYIETED